MLKLTTLWVYIYIYIYLFIIHVKYVYLLVICVCQGTVLAAMEETGYSDNTFIVFVSDHGEMNMEHRQDWKNSMYEASARVPFLVIPPAGQGWNRGITVSNVTSLLDVFPTLIDMTSVVKTTKEDGAVEYVYDPSEDPAPSPDKPDWLDGHSIFPFLYQKQTRGFHYPQNRSVMSQYHSNMANTGMYITLITLMNILLIRLYLSLCFFFVFLCLYLFISMFM